MSNQPDSSAPAPLATPAAAHPSTPFAPAVAPPRAPDTHSPSLTPDADLPPPHITDEQRARLDAHGFDPADYDWEPVNKRVRHDGWTVERQREFIATLADTGSVTEAAATVRMSVRSAYALRRAPGAAGFNRAWAMALQSASQILADLAYERAIHGDDDPVYDEAGQIVHIRKKRSDRLLMFLLRAHQPHIYGGAHRSTILPGCPPAPSPGEAQPAELPPVDGGWAAAETVRDLRAAAAAISGTATIASPLPGLIANPDIARAIDALGPVAPADPLAAMAPQYRYAMIENLDEDLRVRLHQVERAMEKDAAGNAKPAKPER